MRPEIETYLREQGGRYTSKALRAQLVHAGFDAAEVDAALEQTEAERQAQLAETKSLRSQFWGLAFVVNLVVLVAVSAVVSDNSPYAGATFLVLGLAMLIGLGISGSIGGAFLPGRGLLVALAVPAVTALILGGTCFAMMGGVGITRPPSTATATVGTMTLTIDPPLDFSGSGTAQCDNLEGPQVASSKLGSLGDKAVQVVMNGSGLERATSAESPDFVPTVAIEISVFNSTGVGVYYGSPPEGPPIQSHAAADGSRTVTFDRLEKLTDSTDPSFGPDTISGTITWTC